jgi:ParB family chromosome partitioning protein
MKRPCLNPSHAVDLGGTPRWDRPEVLQLIALERLHEDPENPRKTTNLGEMADLVESIETWGILNPLVVRPGPQESTCYLVSGHRRRHAARELNLTHVPCKLDPTPRTRGDAVVQMLLHNAHRVDVPPIDAALAYRMVLERDKISQVELARRLNLNQARISETVGLLDLPEESWPWVNEGRISRTTAIWISRINPPEDRLRWACAAREKKLTGHQARQLAHGRPLEPEKGLADQVVEPLDQEVAPEVTANRPQDRDHRVRDAIATHRHFVIPWGRGHDSVRITVTARNHRLEDPDIDRVLTLVRRQLYLPLGHRDQEAG